MAIALFRWDVDVGGAAVLGVVGTGWIAMARDAALNLFQGTASP